jgi:hypothetical protein
MTKHRSAIRLYTIAFLALALALVAAPASAQYKPRSLNDPATGEQFHIELGGALWYPSAAIVISSGGTGGLAGLTGTQIDAKTDLGLTDQHFKDLQLVLKVSKRNKFRLEYIPILYNQSATPQRTIVFNGIQYTVNIPVNSTLDWKAYRFGYELDVVSRNWGFVGLILETKYTDVFVQLKSPLANEFAEARAPIPAIGGIARYYVMPNISVTGELTGFNFPDTIVSGYGGHYVDFNIYGTVNFTNNVGAQLGYRSMDVGYVAKTDIGSLTLKGLYFGGVLRY